MSLHVCLISPRWFVTFSSVTIHIAQSRPFQPLSLWRRNLANESTSDDDKSAHATCTRIVRTNLIYTTQHTPYRKRRHNTDDDDDTDESVGETRETRAQTVQTRTTTARFFSLRRAEFRVIRPHTGVHSLDALLALYLLYWNLGNGRPQSWFHYSVANAMQYFYEYGYVFIQYGWL